MFKWILILLMTFSFVCSVNAQTSDIRFMQEGQILPYQVEKNYHVIGIKPKPFTILFNGPELHACAGLDETLYSAAKSETDINKDFKSPFFIFKYAALPETGGYLVLYNDGANSLNKSHGAKPFESQYQYTVSSIMKDKNQLPVSNLKQLFFVLWLDKNKDQYIDDSELLRVKIRIKNN